VYNLLETEKISPKTEIRVIGPWHEISIIYSWAAMTQKSLVGQASIHI
jgi:hypothetical protein